jgi:ATP/maltotriose-dependent transcriptional regulator MalT
MLFMQLGSIAWLQGDYAAAQRWADVSLALARERHAADAEAYALGLEGRLAVVRGEYAAARRSFEESLTLTRRLGEGWWESRLLEGLATVALQLGDFTLADALLSDALRIARETGDHWARATLLTGLGDVARARGEYARAGQLYRESVALHQTLGTEPAASLRHNLGYVALHAGDLGQAAAFFGESLGLYRSYAERRGMAECLIGLAGVAASAGNRIHAARLLGAAEATLESLEAQLSPSNRADFSRILARARSGWSAVEFTAAWTAGHRLDLDEGVEEALKAAPVDKAPPDGPLTSREGQVAVLIARGQSNRQIAESLVIAEATAERHVANIFRKLGSRSRAQVATWATQQGLAHAVTAERQ